MEPPADTPAEPPADTAADTSADTPDQTTRLYGELAGWYHLLDAPHTHAEEALIYRGLLDGATEVTTLLELGSGGGNNASQLKAHYRLTLVDASAAMIAVSQGLNPDCEHLVGDMRSVRLERRFDAVLIHDAIDYMTTADDLRAAMETAYVHLRPGGVALLCPDHLRETFTPSTDHGGHDEGSRGLRYLEWTWDPDPSDTTCITDFAYLLREGSEVRVVHDRHVFGLFPRDQWLTTLREVGFRDAQVREGADGIEVLLAVR
jgi:SAM-dependent methyltransferase